MQELILILVTICVIASGTLYAVGVDQCRTKITKQ